MMLEVLSKSLTCRYIAYDEFGTLTGKNESYLVTGNNTALLPPHGCEYHKDWNAYVCEDVCYRTLTLSYNEPGTYEYGKAPLGPGSYVRVSAFPSPLGSFNNHVTTCNNM
jgi:hypothetical protein